jgi:hypothetical protein
LGAQSFGGGLITGSPRGCGVFYLARDFGLNPRGFRVFLSEFKSYEKIFPDRFWFRSGRFGSRGLRNQR